VVRGVLRDRLARFIAANPGFLKVPEPAPPRPIPGSRRTPPLSAEEHAWVNRQLAQMERLLFDGPGGCQWCHQEKTSADRRPGGLPEYFPSGIPARWFGHAVFSHKSHRLLACTECHGGAPASETSRDVLLPGIETCRSCHSPQARSPARSDCVECHTYHPQAEQRAFRGKGTIEHFPR
jgi:hypothetical protein